MKKRLFLLGMLICVSILFFLCLPAYANITDNVKSESVTDFDPATEFSNVLILPEPATFVLLGLGSMVFLRRKK